MARLALLGALLGVCCLQAADGSVKHASLRSRKGARSGGALAHARAKVRAKARPPAVEVSPEAPVFEALQQVGENYGLTMQKAMKQKDQEGRAFERQLLDLNATVYKWMRRTQVAQECLVGAKDGMDLIDAELEGIHKKQEALQDSVAELESAVALRNTARDSFLGEVGDWGDSMKTNSTNRLKELMQTGDGAISAIQSVKDAAPSDLLSLLETMETLNPGEAERVEKGLPEPDPLPIPNTPEDAPPTSGSAESADPMPQAGPPMDDVALGRAARLQLGGIAPNSWDSVYSSLSKLMGKYNIAKGMLVNTAANEINLKVKDPMAEFNATLATIRETVDAKEAEKAKLSKKLETCKEDLREAKRQLDTSAQAQAHVLQRKKTMDERYEQQIVGAHRTILFAEAAANLIEQHIKGGQLNTGDLFKEAGLAPDGEPVPIVQGGQRETVINVHHRTTTAHARASYTNIQVDTRGSEKNSEPWGDMVMTPTAPGDALDDDSDDFDPDADAPTPSPPDASGADAADAPDPDAPAAASGGDVSGPGGLTTQDDTEGTNADGVPVDDEGVSIDVDPDALQA